MFCIESRTLVSKKHLHTPPGDVSIKKMFYRFSSNAPIDFRACFRCVRTFVLLLNQYTDVNFAEDSEYFVGKVSKHAIPQKN